MKSSANAVVVADYGQYRLKSGWRIEYSRHVRIKILNEAGFEWGTYEVSYNHKTERLTRFEGQTIITKNGLVKTIKADKKSIFEEKTVGDIRTRKMTLPSLEPGAIVEYRYATISDFTGFVPRWDFQTTEPTLWSEYIVELPNRFSFVAALRGKREFDILETDEHSGYNQHRWVLTNLQALREEPFMTTLADYAIRLTVQMAPLNTTNVSIVTDKSSWLALGKYLLENPYFGERLTPADQFATIVDSLTTGLSGNLRMEAIHKFVRSTIQWNGLYGYGSDIPLAEVIATGVGHSGQINLILTSMLRAAGFDAHPMLISTREHGEVEESYPIIDQFDYLIAYVDKGGTGIAMDATSPIHPYNLLSERVLTDRGLVIKDRSEWRDVESLRQSNSVLTISAELRSDGSISGEAHFEAHGYAASDVRDYLLTGETEDFFVENIFVDDLPFEVSNARTVLDSLNTFVLETSFICRDYSVDGGDFVYLNPFIGFTIGENPFSSETRNFPVSFTYPFVETYTLDLELPSGYEVVDQPQRVILDPGSGKGMYVQFTEVHSGKVRFVYRFKISTTEFPPGDYSRLRRFYGEVVSLEQDQIVLSRQDSDG